MKPKDVWAMQPEFAAVTYINFRNNFANMKRTIKEHKDRANIDEAGFLHDLTMTRASLNYVTSICIMSS